MENIMSVEEARRKAINEILWKMDNDLPYCRNIYVNYINKIDEGINDCIKKGYVQFILEGERGNLPGHIEALLLLNGYQIERKDENSFYINLIDNNNYKV